MPEGLSYEPSKASRLKLWF